jgi:photosystem II stability/assembly factor-like uncharacterized protein
MKKFIFLFLIISSVSFSQSAWNCFLSTPTTNNYSCVKFIDINTGFICGEIGTILRTTNGGINWVFIETNSDRLFTCIYPVNSSVVYAITAAPNNGQGSQLYKSSNSGVNWFVQKFFPSSYFRAISFLNINSGYISGDGGAVFFTSDGGLNWTDRSTGISNSLQNIQFINNQTGFVSTGDQSGTGNFLKTTNGGLNWISLISLDSYFISFYFKDSNTGIICGGKQLSVPNPPYYYYQEKIFRTSNGGQTWDSTLFSTGGLCRTICNFGNNVYVFGEASSKKSLDFGLTWINLGLAVRPTPRYSCYTDTNIGYIVGDSGRIIKNTSTQIGISQNYLFSKYPITSTSFINANIGYMVLSNGNFYQFSYIYKTTNSGINWFQSYSGYEQLFKNVMFSGNYGVVNGSRQLLLTQNGGNNWSYYWYPTSYDINKSCILPNTKAFAVGDNNVIAQSYNFGTWSAYPISGVGHLKDIAFPDENTGYIISNNNKYLKSTNSGNNWIINTFPYDNIECMYFLNPSTGFICASYKLLKTTNGGVNWIEKPSNNTHLLKSIYFLDTSKGFYIGYYVPPGYTTNGGANWSNINLHYSKQIFCINFINSSTGYITGECGTIFRTTNGGIVWVNNIESKIPENFSLSQNYPNPFNPSTNIKYQIKNNGLVTLTIFDILGKEITTLVKEKQSPGTYEENWDGSAYPSGVYFYKLTAGEFTEIKKMVLIK